MTIATAIAFTVASAYANVGSTFEQSTSIRGAPVTIREGLYGWVNEKWIIFEQYNTKGICNYIAFVKLDGTTITKQEADAIDESNAPNAHQWKQEGPANQRDVDCLLTNFVGDGNCVLQVGTTTDFGGLKYLRGVGTWEGAFQLHVAAKAAKAN